MLNKQGILFNPAQDFYDRDEGDWAWFDIPVTDDGIEFHDRTITIDQEVWYINAFSFHPELGLAMLDEVVEVNNYHQQLIAQFFDDYVC